MALSERRAGLSGRDGALLFLFALTLFVSATLLFVVQPMFAKMVLPLLGGTPAVWNTCVLFFQVALLAGYGYTHLASSKLGPRPRVYLHLVLLAVPLAFLPLVIPAGWTPPGDANPIPWLLGLLLISVGLPFFVVSTTGPLIQKWFAGTGHPASADPYFLYAASNFGSIFGLLGYLALVEPFFTLQDQSRLWTAGYLLLLVLTAACALVVLRSGRVEERKSGGVEAQTGRTASTLPLLHSSAPAAPLTWSRRLRWIGLAFVPSALMLALTTYITTDIAAVPLLWVIPLTLYLLTFMLAFASRPLFSSRPFVFALPMLVLIQAVVMQRATLLLPWMPMIHLGTFFTAAMACHGQLAEDRPPPEHLTEFYLLLSVGGGLGGVFNGLVAPLLFRSVVEYPIILVLACLLCPRSAAKKPGDPSSNSNSNSEDSALPSSSSSSSSMGKPHGWILTWQDLAIALLTGLAAVGILAFAHSVKFEDGSRLDQQQQMALLLGVLAFACFIWVDRTVRFCLCLAVVLFVTLRGQDAGYPVLHQERSFFGVHRVSTDPRTGWHRLFHGTTLHGMQSPVPPLRSEPMTYYYRTGPIGQVFTALGPAARRGS